jgi:hypothetical protein
MKQPKELSLGFRILLFLVGIIIVFLAAWSLKSIINSIEIKSKYSAYLIYLGVFCILLWLFIRSLIKIPIGSVGVPLILNTRYKGFLIPEGLTWLPFIQYRTIDKKKQFEDLNFDIITSDSIPHTVYTNIEYNIVNPFTYLDNNQSEVFKKITGGISENITKYSITKEIEGDSFIKNPSILKQLISDGLTEYGVKYGLSIAEVLIKSIKPNEHLISLKEDLYKKKISELLNIDLAKLNIDLETLGTKKKIEVLALISKETGIDFNVLAKYALIEKGKIPVSEILRTYNININQDLINQLLNIIRK